MNKKNDYKCGVVSVSFRNHSPEEIILAAKEAGLSCIEWGSDVHAPYNDEKKLKEIVLLQKKYGIYCSSYGTYFRLGKNSTDELKGYINAAKLLGTDIMRLWCGDKSASMYSAEEKAFLFDECKKAAEIAEENGMTLCMECHPGSFTETADGMQELMDAVNSSAFVMYWQPEPNNSDEQNFEYAKKIKNYCKRIHVFNCEGVKHYPLSDARVLWEKYLTILDSTDTLLLEFMPDDKIESLKDEAMALISITEEM